jgi:tetratricopeptide (TPR) repeat protein
LALRRYRIAQLLHGMERYDDALTAGKLALAKVLAINDHALIASCFHQIGLILKELNKPQEAFMNFQRSLEIREKIGDLAGSADGFVAIGKILMELGQFKETIESFERAIGIYHSLNQPNQVAMVIEYFGIAFELQGHFSEALEKYEEALRLLKQYSHEGEWSRTERNIARVKGKIGQKA